VRRPALRRTVFCPAASSTGRGKGQVAAQQNRTCSQVSKEQAVRLWTIGWVDKDSKPLNTKDFFSFTSCACCSES
jgi:hypothetical protein